MAGGGSPGSGSSPQSGGIVGEEAYRILCPSSRAGVVIGKGGEGISRLRHETGASIAMENEFPGCDERVIHISSPPPEPGCASAAQEALERLLPQVQESEEEAVVRFLIPGSSSPLLSCLKLARGMVKRRS